ncbi:hypothetical protein Tco_1173944 [Tanacetum coccineum]
MAEGEINNLFMEHYLALTRGNQAPGVVKPEIGGNVNFEIKVKFIAGIRGRHFFRYKKTSDTHEHVEQVLDIVSLFNIPRVSHDAVMLRVFPITLTGAAKRWVDRLPPGTVDSRFSLKKAYPKDTHDINNHQKVNIFYNGLGALNRQLLDLQGPILGMTPVQALTAIQTMADHSQKCHGGSSSRNIESSSNSEGINCEQTRKPRSIHEETKREYSRYSSRMPKLRRAHLDKDCPLKEEVKKHRGG